MNLRSSAIVMKNLPATAWGDALLISREEARRIGYELEQAAERIEALEARATPAEGMAIVPVEMSNHTDGPWKSIATYDKVHVVGGNNGDLLVMLYRNPTHQQMVNARLIAAAPELLEALKDMLAGWRYIRETHGDLYGVGWDRAQQKAEAAIAKAEWLTEQVRERMA